MDMQWKEITALQRVSPFIPPGTWLHVGFLDSEDVAMRVETARAITRCGFAAVPIIAARRLESERMLRDYLTALRVAGGFGSVMVVGGDPARARGPYPDAGSVIGSGILEEHGVREVSLAGHPGGNPAVADADVLWRALAGKVTALERRGLRGAIVTQFGFDPAQVLEWIADLRARGTGVPVRVGVPGPASVRSTLANASRYGVAVSAPVAREYGFSLADPTGDAAPDRFIRALAAGYDAALHGEVRLHFNTFGGITRTANWINRQRAACRLPRLGLAEPQVVAAGVADGRVADAVGLVDGLLKDLHPGGAQ
jgi:methylenetetrahydrofolate reductase (NADPH)